MSVDKPNDPAIGTFGIIDIPPYGETGIPVRNTPFGSGDLASTARRSLPQGASGPVLGRTTSRPVTLVGSYQALAAPTTYGFLPFPPVTPNKIWEVMRIGVTAPDPFTALAGVSVMAFRNSFVPQDSAVEPTTFGDLIAVLGSVPNTSYPAWRSVVVRGHERVVLAFKGLAANQQLQASIDVIEHDLEMYLLSLLTS